jgi:OOP family OmpA-OmpF porin
MISIQGKNMNTKTLPALIALALAGTALSAHAMDDRLYVAPSVNYTLTDSDRKADDGWGAGVALGKPIAPHLNMELSLTGSSLNKKTGGVDYDLMGLGVDAIYLLNRDADFTPYGVLGAGVLRTEIPGAHDTGLMANAGVGIMKRLTDNIDLRADARYRWDGNSTNAANGNNFGDFVVSVGLNIALGQKAQPMPAAQPAPEPMPVTQPAPEPMPVAQPAPQPAPAPEPEPVVQPAEPAPALKTKQAEQLEKAQSGDVVTILEGVNFEFDSSRLRPDAIVILDEAVLVLNHRKDMNVDIVGHTDSIGTKQYNQGLSERRAKSVYDFFVSKGIAADRMTTRGFGETKPVATNKTRAGRAKNRRVELHVK